MATNSAYDCLNHQSMIKNEGAKYLFPGKLHDLLDYAEEEGLDGVISWALDGRGFVIHDERELPHAFPPHFGSLQYTSFRKQLKIWHFQRILEGPLEGAFIHPFFIRGKIKLLSYMSRQLTFNASEFAAQMTKDQYTIIRNELFGKKSQETKSNSLSDLLSRPYEKSNAVVPTPSKITDLRKLRVKGLSPPHTAKKAKTRRHSPPPPAPGPPLPLSSFFTSSPPTTTTTCVITATALSSAVSASQNPRTEDPDSHVLSDPHDGDIVSFAGKNFHFLDYVDSQLSGANNTPRRQRQQQQQRAYNQRDPQAIFELVSNTPPYAGFDSNCRSESFNFGRRGNSLSPYY